MDVRQLKALEIAARLRLVWEGKVCTVPSQSCSGSYKVERTLYGFTCTCEDYELRKADCKHILAAQLTWERERGEKGPAFDTDTIPKKPTYKQNWPAYNEAQTTEKRRAHCGEKTCTVCCRLVMAYAWTLEIHAMNLPLPCPPALPAEELARLEREFAAYRRELPRLLATGQAGRFALFHDDQLVGVWDSQLEASGEGRRRYGLDPITVKRIDPRDRERLAALDGHPP